MNIEEIKADDSNKDDSANEWRKEDLYQFKFLGKFITDKDAEPSWFKSMGKKENIELMAKWGLTEKDMDLAKFRFNQSFNIFNTDKFVKDLLNSYELRTAMPNLWSKLPATVDSVQYEKLTTEVINMGFFDILWEKDIATETGYIKKEPDELLDGMQMGDRLRYALAFEESEHYLCFDSEMRKEFIFRVFQHIALGGTICQYEDTINEYLTSTQLAYKDLVTVFKDSETKEIKVGSVVLQINGVDGSDLFGDSVHPQNWMYVIIDPLHWHVNVWFHKWTSWW